MPGEQDQAGWPQPRQDVSARSQKGDSGAACVWDSENGVPPPILPLNVWLRTIPSEPEIFMLNRMIISTPQESDEEKCDKFCKALNDITFISCDINVCVLP